MTFSSGENAAALRAALRWVRSPETAPRLRIDSAPVALVGHSNGGWLALKATAADPKVACVGAPKLWLKIARLRLLLSLLGLVGDGVVLRTPNITSSWAHRLLLSQRSTGVADSVVRTTMTAPRHRDSDGISAKKNQPAKPEKMIER